MIFFRKKRQKNNKILILMYHRIVADDFKINRISDPFELCVLKNSFFEQMRYLHERLNVISLDECVEQIKNRKLRENRQVVITFDDGYADNFQNAFPVLKTFKTAATIFLTTDYVNSNDEFWFDKLNKIIFSVYFLRSNPWEEINKNIFRKISVYFRYLYLKLLHHKLMKMNKLKRDEFVSAMISNNSMNYKSKSSDKMILSWPQIIEMNKFDISFGSHTSSHQILSRLPLQNVEEEISTSKSIIESNLNSKIDLFAYPFGYRNTYNEPIKNILQGLGFRCACTTEFGSNNLNSDIFELKRVPVKNLGLKRFIKEIEKYFD